MIFEYSKKEGRDILFLPINQTARKTMLLKYAAFELKSSYFQYYFFKHNCSFLISNLLYNVIYGHESDDAWFYSPRDTLKLFKESLKENSYKLNSYRSLKKDKDYKVFKALYDFNSGENSAPLKLEKEKQFSSKLRYESIKTSELSFTESSINMYLGEDYYSLESITTGRSLLDYQNISKKFHNSLRILSPSIEKYKNVETYRLTLVQLENIIPRSVSIGDFSWSTNLRMKYEDENGLIGVFDGFFGTSFGDSLIFSPQVGFSNRSTSHISLKAYILYYLKNTAIVYLGEVPLHKREEVKDLHSFETRHYLKNNYAINLKLTQDSVSVGASYNY